MLINFGIIKKLQLHRGELGKIEIILHRFKLSCSFQILNSNQHELETVCPL